MSYIFGKRARREKFCLAGIGDCDGPKAKATVKIENDVVQINKSSIDLLSKQANKLITDTTTNIASNCSTSILQSNKMKIGDITSSGNSKVKIDKISQKSKSTVDISCVNNNEVHDAVTSEMLNSLMADLKTNTSQEAISKMAAVADAKASTEMGAGLLAPPPSTDSNVEMTNKFKNLTDNQKKITNSVMNEINKKFTVNSVSSCTNSSALVNNMEAGNIKAYNEGEIDIGELLQENSVSAYSNCLQKNNIGSEIANSFVSALDLKVVDDTKQKSDSTQEAEATAESKATGLSSLVESLGTMVGNIFGGIFGSLFGIFALPVVICLVVCCLSCLSSLMVIIIPMFTGNGNGNGNDMTDAGVGADAGFDSGTDIGMDSSL